MVQLWHDSGGDSVGGNLSSVNMELTPHYLAMQYCLEYYLSDGIQERCGDGLLLLKIP